MNTHTDKTQENKSQSVANSVAQKLSGDEPTFQFVDNRPEAVAQRKLQSVVKNNPQVSQERAFQGMAQANITAQLQAMAGNNSAQQYLSIQKKGNNTGLPDNLKTGIENLSGMSLDDVKVHRNSDKPAQLQAHAYAQGANIQLGPGQEKHLPHEAWHVVQQKQGRVKPTMQMKGGVNVNDDKGLEKEADEMGAKALQFSGNRAESFVQKKLQPPTHPTPISRPVYQHKVIQRAENANAFFQEYEISNDIEIPFRDEVFSAGENIVTDGSKDTLGIQSIIPTHPSGKGVDQIAATNVKGFANVEDARLRYGLSVGANAYAGLDKAAEGRAAVEGIRDAATPSFFPMSILAFTWRKVWKSKWYRTPAPIEELLVELGEMEESEKQKVRKRETKSEDGNNTFIYGAVREALIKAPTTEQVRQQLLSRNDIGKVYYHIGDDDASSLNVPPSGEKKGVFDAFTEEGERRLARGQGAPYLLGGGYRIRREDNEEDPGDAPSEVFGTELAEFASDIDQQVRAAMASVDPRIPYYSEANLLVDSDRVAVLVQQPDNPVSGEIFGKNNFESGNLKRFLGLNDAVPMSGEAYNQSGFIPDASLITGTKGSGERFLAYHFKKPKNYLEFAEDDIMKEYRKAISTSQNAGCPANFAINLSIFFQSLFRWEISASLIVNRFLEIAVNTLGEENPLYKALSTEVQTKRIRTGEKIYEVPSEKREIVINMIDRVIEQALTAHLANFGKIQRLIEKYVGDHTFTLNGNAKYDEEGGGTYDVMPIEMTEGIVPGCILMVEGRPKEVVSVGEFDRYFKPIIITFREVTTLSDV